MLKVVCLVAVCFASVVLSVKPAKKGKKDVIEDTVEELLDESRYNSRTRPQADSGTPLELFINMNINAISSISETKMEFSMTLYLRQLWRDERLVYDKEMKNITLNHRQFDRLWTPDVFVRNLKAGVFHQITVPNRLIRLSPDGTILYSQRLTLTLACDMNFDKFPMDNQSCNIELGSYAYTTEDIVFFWRQDASAVEINERISLPEYNIRGISHEICSKKQISTGSFPCLRAHIHLERRLKAYVLSTYLPSFLVVTLSWVSFWIDLDSVPARISLGILTILTITQQSLGQGRFPAVSFTKAIDVWMVLCLMFVCGAFIEYSVVNVLARKDKRVLDKEVLSRKLKRLQPIDSSYNTYKTPPLLGITSIKHKNGLTAILCGNDVSNAALVDKMSRVLFPVTFLIINLVYWPYYLL